MGKTVLGAVLVVVLAAAACGGRSSDDAAAGAKTWSSGTRLRARVHDAGDGAVRFVTWHDAQLDVDCTFVPAEDGALRCLPSVSVFPTMFADAQCKTPAVERPPTCTPMPRFVRAGILKDGLVDTCDFRERAYELTKTDATYRLVNGTCTPQPPPSTSVYAAAPVDAARFVKGEERRVARTGRLAVNVVVAEDGARAAQGLVDVQRSAPCADTSGEGHCLPLNEGTKAATDGASCVVDAVVASCKTKPSSAFVDFSSDPKDACHSTARVRALGPGQLRTYFVPSSSGPCTASASPGLVMPFAADISTDTFPPVGKVVAGGGRMKLRWVSSEGVALVDPTFVDDTIGDCEATADASGTLRCLPTTFFGTRRRYSDPACTVRVLPIFGGPVCDETPRAYVAGSVYDDAAQCTAEVFATGKRVDAKPYEHDPKSGACVRSEVPVAYYELLPASSDRFVQVVERVE